ncbi:hypothetical protein A2368_02310 [Candidatus Collierbacteria bacterium RIFOXYB1_FULL_49_13]|uniref:Fibronectin type-III domain-containing protein n=1 Tax=Candidatus Collierbacteria bacterium RIFOXYB1_FULL_49_13 TaxID=1817728 RepID=A0A1F5FJ06_9BACT|nr:MAG: hypothetical protein A2368_02310 [Candidatus Collierbacteria bacterium RIFOXYB1_FULL_49_13]
MKRLNHFFVLLLVCCFLLTQASPAHAATAVGLGTADSFAVLAGSGITNTGTTTITGDVGSYPTTTQTGFGTVTITGTNHAGDATTQAAKTDLVTAYDDAAGQGPTNPIVADLGGQTLTPGVYNSATSVGLTGTLTLDGEGDPDAVFIIQAGSTLTTASSSQISLTNSAQACNVFWQVGSSATIGTSTHLIGTVIALTSITDDGGSTIDGRLLARNGAVTLNNSTIAKQDCAPTPTPTPTDTPTPTPTPTDTPTPTVESTSTTTSSTSTSTSSSSSGGSSSCTSSGITTVPLILDTSRVSSTSIRVSWGPYEGLNDFIVKYGFSKDDLQFNYKVSGLSTTINDLPTNQSIWVQVAATDNCAVGTFGPSVFTGGTATTLIPRFPNTGNPRLPNTGIGPSDNSIYWQILEAFFLSLLIFLLGCRIYRFSLRQFISILLLPLIFAANSNTIFAQDSPSVLYVPLIGITSVPKPLALTKPGAVTYNYAVKNFLVEVPLSDVQVVDDHCSPIKFITGDDDRDTMLDYSETWRYTCVAKLSETTQSMATATGHANNMTAIHRAYSTVVVGSADPHPLVSIVNITKVAYPLSLPYGGGKITYTYKVNNPGVVPLSDVTVTDDKCSAMSSQLGDTNGNGLLDMHEVWIYTCVAKLKQSTTNTVTVTAFAGGLKAVDDAVLTVSVNTPRFPNTGLSSSLGNLLWKIIPSMILVFTVIYLLTHKRNSRKTK